MLSLAISQSLQVYGIAIVVSMIVAVLIKVLVTLTGRVKRPAAKTLPAPVQAKAEVAVHGSRYSSGCQRWPS